MSEKELQEKYILYQLLQQNLENLRQQLEFVERQFIEIKNTQGVFRDFKKRKGSDDVLIPLGSGCYGSGDVQDLKNVLVNVGANIMVSKRVESAKLFLNEREKELEKAGKEIQEHMIKTAKEINETVMDIQKLANKEK
jgi:prefoldin alpha subunit